MRRRTNRPYKQERDLDAALGDLPIIREMGPGVKTEAWPIYDYRTFAAALNDGTHGG